MQQQRACLGAEIHVQGIGLHLLQRAGAVEGFTVLMAGQRPLHTIQTWPLSGWLNGMSFSTENASTPEQPSPTCHTAADK